MMEREENLLLKYNLQFFAKEGMAIINFEQMHYDIQVGDLAHFMRKILEKHNWNTGLGMDMITAYSSQRLFLHLRD